MVWGAGLGVKRQRPGLGEKARPFFVSCLGADEEDETEDEGHEVEVSVGVEVEHDEVEEIAELG
jgi:hypothetical protein